MKLDWRGDEILAKLENVTDEALFAGGLVIQEAAAQRAVRRTGRLKESGYVGIPGKSTYAKRRGYKREKKSPGRGVAVVSFAARHSHLIEKGTRRSPARPYLRPGLDASAERAGQAIVAEMRKGLNSGIG